MAKSYADLWTEAANLRKEGDDVANFNETVAKLPYQLTEEFRKAGDPKLDKAINKAQSDTFGAAIKGLDMYQDISNPFARRNLAEQYQGGVEMGWKNLVDERTRRQGVYSDYLNKWTGLYGAEAAKRQDMFNNKMTLWNQEKNLADTEENNRRWEIENARAERNSAKKDENLSNTDLIKKVSELKTQGATWQDINDYLVDQYGVDTTEGSFADQQLRKAFGEKAYQASDPLKEEQLRKIKMENDLVEGSSNKAIEQTTGGDYYNKDGSLYKKRGLFGWNWLDYLYPDKKL